MPQTVQFRLVDTFADAPYLGGTAGVVLDADGLSDRQMQIIAREINASESAFVLGSNDLHRPPRLRIFTPTTEQTACGNAVIAAAHAWADAVGIRVLLGKSEAGLQFETAAGTLGLTAEIVSEEDRSVVWWLELPDVSLKPDNTNPMKMTALLGGTMDDLAASVPIMRTRDDDVILLINSWQRLNELKPKFDELATFSARHSIRGFCVATQETLSDFVHVNARYFSPAMGVPEESATGRVHGPLAVMLVINECVPVVRNRAALNCLQGAPGGRAGIVRTLIESTPTGYRASIGGMNHTTIRGELAVPANRDASVPAGG